MDELFDDRVAAAAPRTATRTPELSAALFDLVAATEPASARRRGRRARRTALSAFAAAAVIATGAAAHATGILLPQPRGSSYDQDPAAIHVDVALPGGEHCRVVHMVAPDEGQASAHSQQEWDKAWSVATGYLESIDPSTLTTDAVVERWREAVEQSRQATLRSLGPGETPPRPSEAEIRILAPRSEIEARVNAELRHHDLPTGMFIVLSGNHCDPEAGQ